MDSLKVWFLKPLDLSKSHHSCESQRQGEVTAGLVKAARTTCGRTHNVDHGRQEVDEYRDEDDDVAGGVVLIDPAAGLAQHQRQTLVVLGRGDQDQAAVEND